MSSAGGARARVTVVVPTRNSARSLDACLRSIRGQRDVDVELTVVDNHSTDDSFAIAQRWADRALIGGPERSAQRNAGVRAGSGEWICWIDSDMVLPPGTLRAALDVADASGARAVAVPEITTGTGFWTACRTLERRCYVQAPQLHNPRLLRRQLFEELGGFGEAMAGPEDADLRLRLRERGEDVGYAPQVLIEHDEGRLTLRDVWAKRVYYGRSLPALSAAHPAAVSSQGRELVRTYWRSRRVLAADPLHLAGLAFLRVLEVAGYLWGARAGRGR